eukprot:COSAG01_NODE_3920_length_5536_cov_14.374655_4_plen_139_part_00
MQVAARERAEAEAARVEMEAAAAELAALEAEQAEQAERAALEQQLLALPGLDPTPPPLFAKKKKGARRIAGRGILLRPLRSMHAWRACVRAGSGREAITTMSEHAAGWGGRGAVGVHRVWVLAEMAQYYGAGCALWRM